MYKSLFTNELTQISDPGELSRSSLGNPSKALTPSESKFESSPAIPSTTVDDFKHQLDSFKKPLPLASRYQEPKKKEKIDIKNLPALKKTKAFDSKVK